MTRLVDENDGIEERIYTPRELEYCRARGRGAQHLAARFAGKEAVLKALGTGLGRSMRWTEVEIVPGLRGRPEVYLYGAVAAHADRHGIDEVDVSLSHSAGLAVAHAIAVSSDERTRALPPH